ncbi:MAG: thioredoxin-disulfide reductase [Alphaproteobacteria bacterium]
MNPTYEVLVLGAGPAGWTAALYAARANRKVAVIRGLQPGGQLSITTDVENYPGFAEVIQGPWLMEQMEAQANAAGVVSIDDYITEVKLPNSTPPTHTPHSICIGDGGTEYNARTLIIATGAQARWLGLESESKYRGHGVSACATCDGFFFRGQEVAVIGGGNTAAEEALFLTNFAAKVHLVHRRDTMRAEKILQDRVLKNEKITPHWNHTLAEVIGSNDPLTVTHIRLASTNGAAEETLPINGVFIAIGHDPATALFKNKLKMDNHGYILTAPDSTITEIPGVFAAGDVTDAIFRQAVTAAGMGCMAALEAEKFLAQQE